MAKLIVTGRDGGSTEVESLLSDPVMHSLREAGQVAALCGGMCACATCHVFIDEPWASRLPPRGADEMELLQSLQHFDDRRSRLACQILNTDELDGLILSIAPEE